MGTDINKDGHHKRRPSSLDFLMSLRVLIPRILSYTECLTRETCGDGLAVVLAVHVVVLGYEVVVHLLEVGFLVGGVGLSKAGLPVVGEVLVVLHLFDG